MSYDRTTVESGQVFNCLTVTDRSVFVRQANGRNRRHYVCICVCGNETLVTSWNLCRGHTKSCGCLCFKRSVGNKVVGLSRHDLYQTWDKMMRRCYSAADPAYYRYGGRGIVVCERWHSVANFISDLHPRPKGHTLDRKDNNGNYSPDNCRWATRGQQNSNRKDNLFVTYNGRTQTVSEWSRETGLGPSTIAGRIRLGWPVSRLFSKVNR